MKELSVFSYTPSLTQFIYGQKITIAQIKEVAQQAYDLYKTSAFAPPLTNSPTRPKPNRILPYSGSYNTYPFLGECLIYRSFHLSPTFDHGAKD